jgi:hypothetical protein
MRLYNKNKPDKPKRRLGNQDETKTASSSHIFRRNRTLTGTTSIRFDSVDADSDLEYSDLAFGKSHNCLCFN